MSDFKAKMYQILFPLGIRPGHRWGSLLQRSPKPLAVFKEPILLMGGRGKRGRGREGRLRTKCGLLAPNLALFDQ